MRIAVPAETDPNETRVAATPETVKKLIGLGAEVAIQSGAGVTSGVPDGDYEAAGATIGRGLAETVAGADVILAVRRPDPAALAGAGSGAAVIAIMDPFGQDAALAA